MIVALLATGKMSRACLLPESDEHECVRERQNEGEKERNLEIRLFHLYSLAEGDAPALAGEKGYYWQNGNLRGSKNVSVLL